jgi:hypothetical protein
VQELTSFCLSDRTEIYHATFQSSATVVCGCGSRIERCGGAGSGDHDMERYQKRRRMRGLQGVLDDDLFDPSDKVQSVLALLKLVDAFGDSAFVSTMTEICNLSGVGPTLP